MLFKQTLFFSSFFLAVAAFLLVFFHVRISPSDAHSYTKLTQEASALKPSQTLERHPNHQIRERVKKDVWIMEGSFRSHFCLKSEQSKLFLTQKKDKMDIVEDLFEITCTMQKPEQPPYMFKAVKGTYCYPSHRFIAETVFLEQPNRLNIHADTISLHLQNKNTPPFLQLEGNVRLFSPEIQGKESFALAESLIFLSEPQTLTFVSSFPKRVLFWQEGLSLSAPEVRITTDPLTKKEIIEAKGDAHFTFNLEEQNSIDQLLSKYL